MQKPVQQFLSTCGRAQIFVENEMPIGIFHDFLMEIKGLMVDRMIAAHKEQLTQNEAMKQQDLPPHESELPASENIEVPACESNTCAEEPKGE